MTPRPARPTDIREKVLLPIRAVVVSDHTVEHTDPETWMLGHGRVARDARGRQNPRMLRAEWIELWCTDPACLARVDVHQSALTITARVAVRQHRRDVRARRAARNAPTLPLGGL